MLGAKTTKRNLVTLTDSYKASHYLQYPPDTDAVYSYFEARVGARFPETVFFGLQYLLDEYLYGPVISLADVQEARELYAAHISGLPFNSVGWAQIIGAHGGRLPVSIKAVPEGTVVPVGNVLLTIENTDPRCAWLTNYLETLLVQLWYGCTVATQSRAMRKIILQSLEWTGDPSLIDFKLHDFGFRGVSSVESAGIGGAAHLVNFNGTDTVRGIEIARKYYGEPMAGFSIPAAEHSTITAWGKEGEAYAFANMLDQFPTGMVAVVSDSYDLMHAVRQTWGKDLRDRVLARDGVLVVRPDSGDPPTTVVKVLNALGDAFGYERNDKYFKVLNPKVRVIQGDGIDIDMLDRVLDHMQDTGWSADNVAFGSGGGLLQKLHRDVQRFAMKCSAIRQGGVWKPVSKSPVTDPSKASKAGRLSLIRTHDGGWATVSQENRDRVNTAPDQLVEVFRDGAVLQRTTFAEVRARARA